MSKTEEVWEEIDASEEMPGQADTTQTYATLNERFKDYSVKRREFTMDLDWIKDTWSYVEYTIINEIANTKELGHTDREVGSDEE